MTDKACVIGGGHDGHWVGRGVAGVVDNQNAVVGRRFNVNGSRTCPGTAVAAIGAINPAEIGGGRHNGNSSAAPAARPASALCRKRSRPR